MLDPLSLPLLLKSIDFIYEEYSKLLDERRKRREETRKASKVITTPQPIPKNTIQSKEEALTKRINAKQWQKGEEDIRHLVSLLEIHYGNYRLLSKQYATWTEALVPSVIANGLTQEERKIEEITQQLQQRLAEIYGKDM